jgi:predicted ThiF/HesA family dinucleotide-utilizing enzyme
MVIRDTHITVIVEIVFEIKSVAMAENNPSKKFLNPNLPENATVKLIGLGGVGGVVARYLPVFLSSLNQSLRLVYIDGDNFEPSNATRMLFSSFGNKAAVIIKDLREHFAETDLSLLAVGEYVTKDNIERLIQDSDIVLLAVDNHATRKLISNFCSGLKNIVLISGGNDGIGKDSAGKQLNGTYGNCQVYVRHDGEDHSPSLIRYHNEIADPKDLAPTDKGCTEMLSSVPQILFTNIMTAASILNTFWLYVCDALPYSELAFDISKGLMRPVILSH